MGRWGDSRKDEMTGSEVDLWTLALWHVRNDIQVRARWVIVCTWDLDLGGSVWYSLSCRGEGKEEIREERMVGGEESGAERLGEAPHTRLIRREICALSVQSTEVGPAQHLLCAACIPWNQGPCV